MVGVQFAHQAGSPQRKQGGGQSLACAAGFKTKFMFETKDGGIELSS
jgi:hypothetical protein